MITLLSSVRRSLGLGRSERGQVLVLAAASMVAVLGLAALAIDGGFFAHAHRDAQNDADAMALAGVRELPTTADATTEALNWGGLNDVASGEVQSIAFDTNCDGGSETNTITVRLERTQETFLARVFGINDGAVGVCAAAKIGEAVGGDELLPFGFHYEQPYYPNPNPDGVCYFYDTPVATPPVEHADLWYIAPMGIPTRLSVWSRSRAQVIPGLEETLVPSATMKAGRPQILMETAILEAAAPASTRRTSKKAASATTAKAMQLRQSPVT